MALVNIFVFPTGIFPLVLFHCQESYKEYKKQLSPLNLWMSARFLVENLFTGQIHRTAHRRGIILARLLGTQLLQMRSYVHELQQTVAH